MAIIVGKETKKLLFLGIQNKYCSTCSIAHNSNNSPPPHKCYKNWAKSSCAMEADILVEGFVCQKLPTCSSPRSMFWAAVWHYWALRESRKDGPSKCPSETLDIAASESQGEQKTLIGRYSSLSYNCRLSLFSCLYGVFKSFQVDLDTVYRETFKEENFRRFVQYHKSFSANFLRAWHTWKGCGM